MRTSILSATAICVLCGVSTWGQSKHSQVGTWNVDIAQSTFGLEPVPKSITVVILKRPRVVRGFDASPHLTASFGPSFGKAVAADCSGR
jgi:hypothetical protein